MKTALLLVSLLALGLLSAAGCKRSPQPSPEFERAHREFSALYGRYLDDAYSRPEMADIEATLRTVPPDSLDAEAARKLLERISEGRAAADKTRAEQEAAVANARMPVDSPDSPAAEAKPSPQAEKKAEVPDAGPATSPEPGMPWREVDSRFSGCFTSAPQVFVHGKGMRDTRQLKDIANCRDRHPGYASKLVVEDEGKVLALVEKSQVQMTVLDAGTNP